jgi:hypothetical protein
MKNNQTALMIERCLSAAAGEKCHSLWHFLNCSRNGEAGWQ